MWCATRWRFLSYYIILTVNDTARRRTLAAALWVIVFWMSQLPQPPFKLGWTGQTLLTADERWGRLGILAQGLEDAHIGSYNLGSTH